MPDSNEDPHLAEIKEIAAVYYREHGADMETSMAALSEDVIYHGRADSPPSLAMWKERELRFRAAMTDITTTIHSQVAEGDTVVTYWTLEATHSGEFMGRYPPSGERIRMNSMCIDRVENGKVVEHWGVRDLLAVLRKIGAVAEFNPKKA